MGDIEHGFDLIFIDTPPVLAVVDALILCTLVDGVVLVVHPKNTPRKPFFKAIEQIRQTKTTVLGVVFNKVDENDDAVNFLYYS